MAFVVIQNSIIYHSVCINTRGWYRVRPDHCEEVNGKGFFNGSYHNSSGEFVHYDTHIVPEVYRGV